MKISEEKQYWDSHFSKTSDANELFFRWYAEVKYKLFSPRPESFSFELGPGASSFSRMANVDVIADVSIAAVRKTQKNHICLAVVACASHLPFKEGVFETIYVNDVMHHLKAEGILYKSCQELRRVLSNKGRMCVSDRLPSFYQSLLLNINSSARYVLLFMMKTFGKEFALSGGDDEPPMCDEDFKVIYNEMEILTDKKWRSWIVFWVYGMQQFVNILAPTAVSRKLAEYGHRLCVCVESSISDRFKTDVCVTLEKKAV